jgi:hypothetical protein
LWRLASGDGFFTFPAELFALTGSLKIHDWYCLNGALGAYVLMQCRNLDIHVRNVLIDWLYALSVLPMKTIRESDLPGFQQALNSSVAAALPVLPVHMTMCIACEQTGHFEKQVTLGGPTRAHATLDTEASMVSFKTLLTSSKNMLEGAARMYAFTEMVFYWTLTPAMLELPDTMVYGHVWRGTTKPVNRTMDPREEPLASILGLWAELDLLPPLLVQYYAEIRSERVK